MENILDIAAKWAIPTILSGILGVLIWAVKLGVKKFTNLEKEVSETKTITINNDLVMLWGLLQMMTEQVLTARKCDTATMACIDELFCRYNAMSGNHGMNIRVAQCRDISKGK